MIIFDLLFLPVQIEMIVDQQDNENNDANNIRFDIIERKLIHPLISLPLKKPLVDAEKYPPIMFSFPLFVRRKIKIC